MPVQSGSCDRSDNTAIIHTHDQDDQIISYSSRAWKAWGSVGTMMNIQALVDFWSDKNGCPEVIEDRPGSGLHVLHDGCDGGGRVEHHRLSSGGHCWPERVYGIPTHRVSWDFVSAFGKP